MASTTLTSLVFTKQQLLDFHQQTPMPESLREFLSIASEDSLLPVAKLPLEEQEEVSDTTPPNTPLDLLSSSNLPASMERALAIPPEEGATHPTEEEVQKSLLLLLPRH